MRSTCIPEAEGTSERPPKTGDKVTWGPEMNKDLEHPVQVMIRDNPDVRKTVYALRERGASRKAAKEEIARAFLGCLWEANSGMPDRWSDVLKSLQDGRTTAELFPDSLYEGGPPGSIAS